MAHENALARVFGSEWKKLSANEQKAVLADFSELVTEFQEDEPDLEEAVHRASQEYRRRIGGGGNLKSYAEIQARKHGSSPVPRIVRNWWIIASATGRTDKIAFGPDTSKTGEFSMTIFQRSKGDVKEAAHIRGIVKGDTLEMFVAPGDFPFDDVRVKTERE